MVYVSKTINPIHFEDLEPHRFEDLVRQLIYDLKNWRSLEATGRAGGDDGFDVRGLEVVDAENLENENDDKEENEQENTTQDRLWQIQCKREKSIAPAKIKNYLKDILSNQIIPYGVIFVAACDFSKKTRDVFIDEIRKKGVQEFYLFGKAELEDLLFQPKNDHLLFAYFGISLAMRKRSERTNIRSLLTIKRKVINHLGKIGEDVYNPVLIRDPKIIQYPYYGDKKKFKEKPLWKGFYFIGHSHNGLKFITHRFNAYIDDDKKHWDAYEKVNLVSCYEDEWNRPEESNENPNWKIYNFCNEKIEKKNKAYFEVEKIIPYDAIIEIDQFGDVCFEHPHIFVNFDKNGFPPFSETNIYLRPPEQWGFQEMYMSDELWKNRIKFFPDTLPEPEPLKKETDETSIENKKIN